MRKTFKDPELQKSLEDNGYAVVNVLEGNDIDQLRKIYQANPPPDIETPFYTTHWSKMESYRRHIDKQVRPILSKKILPVLDRYKAIMGYFLVKRPHAESRIGLHQDWAFVDENKYTGLIIWSPLSDVVLNNGSFHIVKMSHKFGDNIRGSNIACQYDVIEEYINDNYLTEMPLMAGQTMIFDLRLWHYSPPNFSEKHRVCAGIAGLPEEADVLHYYSEDWESDEIGIYNLDDELLLKFGYGDKPTNLNKLGTMVKDHTKLTEEQFDELYDKYNDNQSK
ncbi:MAG: phytanoyl-CoA dioxygenase family protein [Bacteroidetes bacterium]|nr:phytanoyl-CoA dioxygenase family protein [Bacteroidota bacterium]